MTCDQFRQMPPLRHDRNPAKSAVLAHIQTVTGCDLPQAIKTFHYLRNKRHLVFNSTSRLWKGIQHTPEESDQAYRSRMEAIVASLELRVRTLEAQITRMKAAHNLVCDHLGL